MVLSTIPRQIPGVDTVETLIVDDGSSDSTVQVARNLGVDHIIRHRNNKGLAAGFTTGIHESLSRGADIIVNTDGDNQYPQQDIPRLIAPIMDGTHDIVVGDRQTDTIEEFSAAKKMFQKVGSNVVQQAAGVRVADAPSGFRAYSREAAMRLNIITDFSYTMESIIQAGKKRIAITHVPVTTNAKTRESRLFKSMSQHMRKSGTAIVRSYTMYQALTVFLATGLAFFVLGLLPYLNYAMLVLLRHGEKINGHLQSLVAGAVLMILGFLVITLGVVADLLSINRKLLEDALLRLKRVEYTHSDYEEVLSASVPGAAEQAADGPETAGRKFAPTFGETARDAR
jgi:glycosyltransferase involved in cell wall biosynthesis